MDWAKPMGHYKMRREAFKFWGLVRLILETLRYFLFIKCLLLFTSSDLSLTGDDFVLDIGFLIDELDLFPRTSCLYLELFQFYLTLQKDKDGS